MLAASSASGSTSPLHGGSHLVTPSTTMPPRPTRPPLGAPLPADLRSRLSKSDVNRVRRDLARSILQSWSDFFKKTPVKLLETHLVVSWKESSIGSNVGQLWVAIRPRAFQLEGSPEIFFWPMHLTLFQANFVHKPCDVTLRWTQMMVDSALSDYGFKAAGKKIEEIKTEHGVRVLVDLDVRTNMDNKFKQVHQRLFEEVWQQSHSTCSFTQKANHNFHLSMD